MERTPEENSGIRLTRSKAVEHARGWVATKIGFEDIVWCTVASYIPRLAQNSQQLVRQSRASIEPNKP